MRIDRLDLIKYGKFSGESLAFPAAPADFHLVVGPNEAGKSTVRAAILDLLFGIPARTPLNFLHPHNELRLGAVLSTPEASLELHRVKGLKKTLRTPQDEPLDDEALAGLLGGADRRFFDQMFGLDHPRLVEGGNSILNAENDIGQVLFQSAAGIASLGKVRDALEAEADSLWAPKKSASRAYYAAATQLDEATAALKDATVRTREWTQAHEQADRAAQALADAGRRLRELESHRARLERVRRLAPYLRELAEGERQLADLGAVIDLPADALTTLDQAGQEHALNTHLLAQRARERDEARARRNAIVLDDAALARAGDIERLEALRLRYGDHARAIERCRDELAALRAQAARLCQELGWPAPDDARPPLPPLLHRRELDALARSAPAAAHALQTARTERQAKQDELSALDAQLARLGDGAASPALRAALQHARSLGDTLVQAARLDAAMARARAAADAALRALGVDEAGLDALAALAIPDADAAAQAAQARRDAAAELRAARLRLDELNREAEQAELALRQFEARHQPVTPERLRESRGARDRAWTEIKTGRTDAAQAAPVFETLIQDADRLADLRLEHADAAAQLQSRQHDAERSALAARRQAAHCQALQDETGRLDRDWQARIAPLGRDALPPAEFLGWLSRRDAALGEAAALRDAERERDQFRRAADAARQSLLDALRSQGQDAPGDDSLPALILRAEQYVQALDDARVRRDTLAAQRSAAQSRLDALTQGEADAQAAQARWNAAWTQALAACALPPGASPPAAESALALMTRLDGALADIAALRADRLAGLQADLDAFQSRAGELASALAPDLAGQPSADISLRLSKRLAQARANQAEAERTDAALRAAEDHVRQAETGIAAAQARLQPLMERAGAADKEALRNAIHLSDQHRRLTQAAASALSRLLADGDGLDRAAIEAEVGQCDRDGLPAALAQIQDELAQLQDRQHALATGHAQAQTRLDAISGADTAAQCEARRQEALAQMADAAERYVRVQTASRLLRWSIDRYREQKQGPMLSRAGELFARLTLGSFQRLSVDFDQTPMTLQGRRHDGRLVPISGMSDGTRDQLYLALRLAALELRLRHAAPLPLVADDLFINYDEARTRAGLAVLADLSRQTQVIFLSHHAAIAPIVRDVLGDGVNVVTLPP